MSEWLRVKNWDRFQHYKNRCPPWIKLHYAVMDDYAWSHLPDASKAHLTGIWLLASRYDGRVPNDPGWIGKKIGATCRVDLSVLVKAGFLEQDASTVQAERKQNAPLDRDRVETEKESETETDSAGVEPDLFEDAWKAYPQRPNNPKVKARKQWAARVKEGVDPGEMLDGVRRYAAYCRREKTEPRYIKLAATFFGPDQHWASDYTPAEPQAKPRDFVPSYHQPYKPNEDHGKPLQFDKTDPRVLALVKEIGNIPEVA